MAGIDAKKLQKLIRQRRRELGLTPSRWRMIFNRLAITAAILGGLIL